MLIIKSIRRTIWSIALISISIGAYAQKDIYISGRFDELTQDHRQLAIVPFITHLDLGNDHNQAEEQELARREGQAVQFALQSYFTQRRKRKKFNVRFQDVGMTNSLLKENGITYQNLDVKSVQELCRVLKVDGIISGSIDLNILLSKGVPTELSWYDYFRGSANYGRIGIKISDGGSGKLLWRYEKAINRKSGKNTVDMIDKMMKAASRKFPYDKEKKAKRKATKE